VAPSGRDSGHLNEKERLTVKKIRATIKDITGQWEEDFEIEDDQDAIGFMREILVNFNDTLREGEPPRSLVSVKVLGEDASPTNHDWEKSNLVTVKKGGRCYDTYRCKRCGITGKRFGFGGAIKHDRKFRSKYHYNCGEVLKRKGKS
jgi:hypothetical protein